MYDNDLIYGKSKTLNIVAVEYASEHTDEAEIFFETSDGITSKKQRIPRFLLTDKPRGAGWHALAGNLPLSHIKTFKSMKQLWGEKREYPKNQNWLHVYDENDSALLLGSFTLFKGMEPLDVSTLAFDIEATGFEHDDTSKVLLITNTFRQGNFTIRTTFAFDDFASEAEMLTAWSAWVRELNPTIICGHNIFTYDLPYLQFCASRNGIELELGRDGSPIKFNKYDSKFRRDGSQDYTYKGAKVHGRHLIDTFFLSIKYDVQRKYSSYGLKNIIKQEGLEIEGRQHYDGALIRFDYKDPAKWELIKRYGEQDADDALKVFDLMIPAFFYFTQMTPMTLQNLINTASGTQLNRIFIRAYLQDGHGIPLPDTKEGFEGALSDGNVGVYNDVWKLDVASLYPSLMLQYGIEDRNKDPEGYILKILKTLTAERLDNKRLAKLTGNRKFKDLESSQKIVINSIYGLLGAPGLNFNSMKNAALVTERGRDTLNKGIDIATQDGFQIANLDTDSISITSGQPLSQEFRNEYLDRFNTRFPDLITWSDDGYFERVLIVKAKNYILESKTKKTIKGSALKATTKEPALRRFIEEFSSLLISRADQTKLVELYNSYVKQIMNLEDITDWAHKRTITTSVLNGGRTNEQKVLDAIEGLEYAQGDKHYFYYDIDDQLQLAEKWRYRRDHNKVKLLKKLYMTLVIFDELIDIKAFYNYSLKRHIKLTLPMVTVNI